MKTRALLLMMLLSLLGETGCATAPRPAKAAKYENPDSSQPPASFVTAPVKKPSWFRRMVETSLIVTAQQAPGSPR